MTDHLNYSPSNKNRVGNKVGQVIRKLFQEHVAVMRELAFGQGRAEKTYNVLVQVHTQLTGFFQRLRTEKHQGYEALLRL